MAIPDTEELARMVGLGEGEAASRLRELQYGRFLYPLDQGEFAMQLKFPEDLDG